LRETEMVPAIFRTLLLRGAAGKGEEALAKAQRDAGTQAAAVLGVVDKLERGSPKDLLEAMTAALAGTSADPAKTLDAARANRPDLVRLARLADSREEAVTSAKSGGLPTVSAYGGWALRKGPTNSFGDSSNGWLLGVQSDWAIFDGRATQGRVAQARSALTQTQLALAEARLAVEVEVTRAHSQWQQASELAEAVFMTGIFLEVAVGTSMLSTPAPARTMSFMDEAFSMSSLVRVVAERITIAS